MATVQSGFGPILLAVQQQLRAQLPALSLNPSLCQIVARDIVPNFAADQDVLVRAGSFISLKPVFDGAGKTCIRFKRFILVYPRTRYAVDEAVSDEQAVTDTTYGMLPWEESVALAIQDYWPARANNDSTVDFITCDPIRISDGTDPLKGDDKMWGSSCLHFEVDYLFQLNGTEWSPPIITTTSVNNTTRGAAYSQALSVVATLAGVTGTGPYVWTSLGTLPPGLSLSSGGVISGTVGSLASATGAFQFTAVCTDANGHRACVALCINVSSLSPTNITTSSPHYPQLAHTALTAGTKGTAYSLAMTLTNASGAVAWTATGLPTGLTIHPTTGVISGVPSLAGTWDGIVIVATDTVGEGHGTYSLVIAAAAVPTITISPTTLSNATVAVAYSQLLSASGGTSPYTFSVVSGSLPTGITLSSAGLLAGTP